ncbi:MAG TPA: hypothetical protein VNQ90_19265 [Chthoniobacteraceae bacterium]|nr:hypothetical protein [Chthoniobacteraceae bacterium]
MPEPLTIAAAAMLLPYASGLAANSWGRSLTLQGDTVASIQQCSVVVTPTGMTSVMTDAHLSDVEPFAAGVADGADWMALSQEVFGDSRSMTDAERKALDEFTWAQLQS